MLEMHLAQTSSDVTISRSRSDASCILVCDGGGSPLCITLYALEIRPLFCGFRFNGSYAKSLIWQFGESREMFGDKTCLLGDI